jgi:ComF family protein
LPRENVALPAPREVVVGWLRAMVDLLYPPGCMICRRALMPEEKTLCLMCRARLSPAPAWQCKLCGATGGGEPPEPGRACHLCPSLDASYQGAFAVTGYFAESARAVHLFKYERRLELGRVMAELMRERLTPSLQKMGRRLDCIVPVPLHWARRMQRGFNQSHMLARALAESSGLAYAPRLLRRVRYTRRQALIPHERRAANIEGAFALCGKPELRNKGVLLVDDVVTTGVTINECAKVLKHAGVREVWVACFARARTGLGIVDQD